MLSCWPGSANIDRSISTPKSKLSSRQPGSTSAAKHPRKSRFRLSLKSRLYFRTDAVASCVSAEVIITEPSLRQAEKPLRFRLASVVIVILERRRLVNSSVVRCFGRLQPGAVDPINLSLPRKREPAPPRRSYHKIPRTRSGRDLPIIDIDGRQ